MVVGGSGLLGQHLLSEAKARGLDALGTYAGAPMEGQTRVDLGDSSATVKLVRDIAPRIVLLAAAMTRVDACEAHPDEARAVNGDAPGEIAKACASSRARLVFFSTDYVFDGGNGPYDEDAETGPLNVYGRTKLEGERHVLAALPGALILRTSANFGWNRSRGKENSVTWILGKLRRGEEVPLFTDQKVSPSYVPEVARMTFDLLEAKASGVYHAATRGCLTRHAMGEAICEVFRLSKDLLKPSRLADAKLAAPRPRDACLSTGRLERLLHITPSTFREALEHMRDSE